MFIFFYSLYIIYIPHSIQETLNVFLIEKKNFLKKSEENRPFDNQLNAFISRFATGHWFQLDTFLIFFLKDNSVGEI